MWEEQHYEYMVNFVYRFGPFKIKVMKGKVHGRNYIEEIEANASYRN